MKCWCAVWSWLSSSEPATANVQSFGVEDERGDPEGGPVLVDVVQVVVLELIESVARGRVRRRSRIAPRSGARARRVGSPFSAGVGVDGRAWDRCVGAAVRRSAAARRAAPARRPTPARRSDPAAPAPASSPFPLAPGTTYELPEPDALQPNAPAAMATATATREEPPTRLRMRMTITPSRQSASRHDRRSGGESEPPRSSRLEEPHAREVDTAVSGRRASGLNAMFRDRRQIVGDRRRA